jgi:hypothetical protein
MVNCDLKDGDATSETQEAFTWADGATLDGVISAEDVLATINASSDTGELQQFAGISLEDAAGVVADMAGTAGAASTILTTRVSSAVGGADYSEFARFLTAQFSLHL